MHARVIFTPLTNAAVGDYQAAACRPTVQQMIIDLRARFWSSSRCFCVADFVRAAQGFCVVGLLTYAVSLVILVAYLAVPFLQETRGVLIALCLLTFSAGGYGTVAMT